MSQRVQRILWTWVPRMFFVGWFTSVVAWGIYVNATLPAGAQTQMQAGHCYRYEPRSLWIVQNMAFEYFEVPCP